MSGKNKVFTVEVIKPEVHLLTPQFWIGDFMSFLESRYRTCYKSEARSGKTQTIEEFIKSKLKCNPPHESPLEHLSLSVKIIGDRSMSHQLVRHRLAAYSQESQRYVKYNKRGYQVICPPSIAVPLGEYMWMNGHRLWCPEEFKCCLMDTPEVDAVSLTKRRWMSWIDGMYHAFNLYERLVLDGVPTEDARSVLPNASKTEVDATFNLRQWRHVFRERALNPRAQWQIRYIMQGILVQFATFLPVIFEDQMEELTDHRHLRPLGAEEYFGPLSSSDEFTG